MNNKFDELTKQMAQSVTRRAALKKFGVGLAGMALACFGLANQAHAGKRCSTDAECGSSKVCCNGDCEAGIPDWCDQTTDACCCGKRGHDICNTYLPSCAPNYVYCTNLCGFSCFGA